jgi:hypothetical protein
MERRELWRHWFIAKAKSGGYRDDARAGRIHLVALEEFTKINPDASQTLKAPLPGQTHLDRGKAGGGGEGYPPADPAPPAPSHISDAEQTELRRRERVANS